MGLQKDIINSVYLCNIQKYNYNISSVLPSKNE